MYMKSRKLRGGWPRMFTPRLNEIRKLQVNVKELQGKVEELENRIKLISQRDVSSIKNTVVSSNNSNSGFSNRLGRVDDFMDVTHIQTPPNQIPFTRGRFNEPWELIR